VDNVFTWHGRFDSRINIQLRVNIILLQVYNFIDYFRNQKIFVIAANGTRLLCASGLAYYMRDNEKYQANLNK
jgi:hypothetical protein